MAENFIRKCLRGILPNKSGHVPRGTMSHRGMSVTESVDREKEICELYRAGASLRDIGYHMRISHETVRKILRSHGISKEDRLVNRSERQAFVGVDLPKLWKHALRTEAAKRGVTMSALVTEAFDR